MNNKLKINVLGKNIGAEIFNLDLTKSLDDNEFYHLYNALIKHQVLFFREQIITPQQQKNLALKFGNLYVHPIYPNTKEAEEIIILDTNQNNPPDNDNWHTDVTFIKNPPIIALLSSKMVPYLGGDTLWASNIAAYESLSTPIKKLLNELYAEHDFKKSFPIHKYCKTKKEYLSWKIIVSNNLPIQHPVVITHAISKKKSLFINEGFTTKILNFTDEESRMLLEFLFNHIKKPEFQVRWKWAPNDLVIWDNRVTQHYANADYYPHRRIMHRATILNNNVRL